MGYLLLPRTPPHKQRERRRCMRLLQCYHGRREVDAIPRGVCLTLLDFPVSYRTSRGVQRPSQWESYFLLRWSNRSNSVSQYRTRHYTLLLGFTLSYRWSLRGVAEHGRVPGRLQKPRIDMATVFIYACTLHPKISNLQKVKKKLEETKMCCCISKKAEYDFAIFSSLRARR